MSELEKKQIDELISSQWNWGVSCNDCNEIGFAEYLADLQIQGKTYEEIKKAADDFQ